MLTGCSWGARGVRRGRRGRRGRGVPLKAQGPPGPACLRTQGTWCPGVPYEARGVVPGLTRGDCRTKLETTRDPTIPHAKHFIHENSPCRGRLAFECRLFRLFFDGIEKSHLPPLLYLTCGHRCLKQIVGLLLKKLVHWEATTRQRWRAAISGQSGGNVGGRLFGAYLGGTATVGILSVPQNEVSYGCECLGNGSLYLK